MILSEHFNVEYLNVPQMQQNAFRAEQPFFHLENLKKNQIDRMI
jgi:hypothetical protein